MNIDIFKCLKEPYFAATSVLGGIRPFVLPYQPVNKSYVGIVRAITKHTNQPPSIVLNLNTLKKSGLLIFFFIFLHIFIVKYST